MADRRRPRALTETLWPALLILAAGLWAYHNSFSVPFLLDDEPFIVDNPHLRSPLTAVALLPPRGDSSWRPVLMLSLAANYALGGLDVRGYHAVNLAIHLLAALLLYGLVRRTLGTIRLRARYGAHAPWLALAAALLWVAHPLNTQSVSYVVQRGESLAGLWYLLTLYGLVCMATTKRWRRWAAVSIAACALGMGTKPVMATAPLMAAAYDRIFLARNWRDLFRRRRWFYTGLASTWLLLAVCLLRTPATDDPTSGFHLARISPLTYALTQPGVILHYLRLALWPHPLCFDYGWPVIERLRDALPSLWGLAALLGATGWALRRRPSLGFLGLWFFLVLLPTSSVIPLADPAFEYRMYLPLAAVVTLAVLGVWHGFERTVSAPPTRRTLGVGLTTLAVGSLVWVTVCRHADYYSAISLWSQTVCLRPQNARAHSNLGVALAEAGYLNVAGARFIRAIELQPRSVDALYNLGLARLRQSRPQEAVQPLEEAARLAPHDAEVQFALSRALTQDRRPPK